MNFLDLNDLEPCVLGFFEDLGLTTEEEIGDCISFIANLLDKEEDDIIDIITEEIENENIADPSEDPYISDVLEAIRTYAEG